MKHFSKYLEIYPPNLLQASPPSAVEHTHYRSAFHARLMPEAVPRLLPLPTVSKQAPLQATQADRQEARP